MKLSTKQLAIGALCLTALSFVVLNISARMMDYGFGTFTQVYLRIGFAALLALLIFHRKIDFKKLKHLPKRDWLLLLVMGSVGYGIAVIFVTLSVLNTTLLNVAMIGSTVPFIVLLYMFLFARKTISLTLFGFLLISFLGVYTITTKSFSPTVTTFGVGELYGVLFAAGTAAFITARKFLSKKLANTEITVITIWIAFISSFIGAMVIGEKLDFSGFANPLALAGLVLGTVLNITTTLLQTYGYSHLPAVTGAQILLLQNVFAPVLGFLFYAETVLPIEFLGAGLILLGVSGYYKKSTD